ncbi:MAG: KH domain-containing protein [Patescibacteria group bacterium]
MSSTIDQDFIIFIVKSIVEHPDDVIVDRIVDEKGVLLTLNVHDDDLGRVIGKRGATAQSLRTLLRALGTKNEARYNLKIADNGTPPPAKKDEPADDTQPTEEAPVQQEQEPETEGGVWGAEPEEAAEQPDVSMEVGEPEESAVEKAKRELADLDDLDI